MATNSSIIEPTAAAVSAKPNVGQLTFTGRRADEGIDLWSPAAPTGDWAEQCRVGREYGSEAIAYIRATNDAAMLPGVVRAIAERGNFGGVEVGFFAAVSMELHSRL